MMPDIGGLIIFLLVWAAIGALAVLGGAVWVIVWAIQHVRFI